MQLEAPGPGPGIRRNRGTGHCTPSPGMDLLTVASRPQRCHCIRGIKAKGSHSLKSHLSLFWAFLLDVNTPQRWVRRNLGTPPLHLLHTHNLTTQPCSWTFSNPNIVGWPQLVASRTCSPGKVLVLGQGPLCLQQLADCGRCLSRSPPSATGAPLAAPICAASFQLSQASPISRSSPTFAHQDC